MKQLLLAGAIIFAAACTDANDTNQPDPLKADSTAGDSTITAFEVKPATDSSGVVKGKVEAIQRGKDGYTAKLVTAGNKIFFVTISHANLKDHTQYRTVAVGDTLSVKGDTLTIGNEAHITVREIR